jgi:hypothetical protein
MLHQRLQVLVFDAKMVDDKVLDVEGGGVASQQVQ